MFEARLAQAQVLKKLLEAVKELIQEANFEVQAEGMSLQAMDGSHVSLVSLHLRSDGFEHFRCDRPFSMGMNLNNMDKMMKCAGKEDTLTMRAEDDGDTVAFLFEAGNQARVSEFELKLMDITSENLGIPDNEYAATVRMPSGEFQRIVKDLATIGDTVEIVVSKEGIKFSANGDIGSANVLCRHSTGGKEEEQMVIDMVEPVSLTFSLRYLTSFTKATPLAPSVTIMLSRELPVVVEYKVADLGWVRYYLAPKIEEDEDMDA
ncbi:Proliferating cell nuclear antigen [Micractinium conductrix]|uniref:DNA sliding clamp PCNA n=1 Tax=Micractinium conductrix TaxID=554055 RepID=A0A2P6VBA0_9CHLO|nr:Proliferating cell nuclear antigen [Micractinium conductrix]|eukprot:PSC71363.1 Proliferating cell nuclear antigen [Micractinium conductrix]